ncbi:unnamed protein product [Gulo gulo]|uniref:Uncharacterized protein n=1 Tax=Gulo gulo TaxID=48420 RepID=A0A9X9LVS5_GULGU|nr:unnamed protein product [Gulo gulo]
MLPGVREHREPDLTHSSVHGSSFSSAAVASVVARQRLEEDRQGPRN